MKYINAKYLLPDALVKELQNYIQGGYIYVPADQAHQKQWGEISGYRKEIKHSISFYTSSINKWLNKRNKSAGMAAGICYSF